MHAESGRSRYVSLSLQFQDKNQIPDDIVSSKLCIEWVENSTMQIRLSLRAINPVSCPIPTIPLVSYKVKGFRSSSRKLPFYKDWLVPFSLVILWPVRLMPRTLCCLMPCIIMAPPVVDLCPVPLFTISPAHFLALYLVRYCVMSAPFVALWPTLFVLYAWILFSYAFYSLLPYTLKGKITGIYLPFHCFYYYIIEAY